MLYVNKDKAGEIKMVSKVAVFFLSVGKYHVGIKIDI